jgi:PAS domain S-box-containing protein
MTKRNRVHQQTPDEIAELKSRLEETEETLQAIRQHLVDAFVVTRASGEQVMTLNEADIPYRMMVESMNEGAVTLIPDGTIFYCNPRFGELIRTECEKLIGVQFRELIAQDEREAFEAIYKEAAQNGTRGEFSLQAANGQCVLVQLSIYQLGTDLASGISIIATDITERVQAEEKIRSLASKLAMAEQEERHRISQVLHDDLQQRLFAIKAQLSFLKDAIQKDKASLDIQADFDQIQRWLSEALSTTRSLSIDLSPILLQGEGLAEAILWLASQMKEQYGLEVKLEVKEDLHFQDTQMRVLIFQAVREALFNVVKHADVLKTVVMLEQADGYGYVTVSDTGKGFDVERVMNDSTLAHGLLIVQDRLNLLGSNIEVASKPGDGTRIVIKTPMERTTT